MGEQATNQLKDGLLKSVAFLHALHARTGNYPTLTHIAIDANGTKGKIETKAFPPPPGSAEVPWKEIHSWVSERDGKGNTYFLLNTPRGPKNSKSNKSDIAAAAALHVDCDVRVGEDQTAGVERIAKQLQAYNPRPSIIINSGGGCQALWLLDKPFPIGNAADISFIESLNKKIEQDLDADHCFNVDRILRLPGTTNIPDAKKRAKGRARALACIVEADGERRYSIEQFNAPPVKPKDGKGIEQTTRGEQPKGKRSKVTLQRLKQCGVSNEVIGFIVNGIPPNVETAGGEQSTPGPIHFKITAELMNRGIRKLADIKAAFKLGKISADADQWPRGFDGEIERNVEKLRTQIWPGSVHEKTGQPLNNYQNTKEAISKLGIECGYDEFRCREFVECPDDEIINGTVTDKIISRIRDRISVKFKFYPDKEATREAVGNLCTESPCNPPREWLDSLTWDGTPRLDGWLHDYCGAANTKLNAAIGRKVFCATVRRIKQPGCKWDHELVLAGAQGIRKSMLCEDLAIFPDLFTDASEAGLSIKETIEVTQGKQIIECPEMAGFSVRTRERVKASLTRKIDQARLAYDRYRTEMPRSSITIGTTNPGGYLNDPTGERRNWHVEITTYDRDAFLRDKAQLYAEAVAKEPNENLWLDDAELVEQHAAAVEAAKEPNELVDVLASVSGHRFQDEERISTSTVRRALGITDADTARLHGIGRRINEAMLTLGWSRFAGMACEPGGKIERGFKRPWAMNAERPEVPF